MDLVSSFLETSRSNETLTSVQHCALCGCSKVISKTCKSELQLTKYGCTPCEDDFSDMDNISEKSSISSSSASSVSSCDGISCACHNSAKSFKNKKRLEACSSKNSNCKRCKKTCCLFLEKVRYIYIDSSRMFQYFCTLWIYVLLFPVWYIFPLV